MLFRNLTMFRLPLSLMDAFVPTMREDGASVERIKPVALQAFEDAPLKDVGPLEFSSQGFIAPHGRDSDVLLQLLPDESAAWFSVGTQTKLMPAAVVADKLARKLDDIEQREARRPGGKTRKRLRDDLIHELLPTAMVLHGRTDAMLDLRSGVLYVDTPSRKRAEAIASEVRGALGSFPAMPLNAEVPPRSILTGWLAGEPLPHGLHLGESCELRDPVEGGAIVRCTDQDLHSDEIGHHLEAGKLVTKLALTLDDHLSFVLGEDLVIRKLKFLDGATDTLPDDIDDLQAELEARFALQAAELRRLFHVLEDALKLSKVEG